MRDVISYVVEAVQALGNEFQIIRGQMRSIEQRINFREDDRDKMRDKVRTLWANYAGNAHALNDHERRIAALEDENAKLKKKIRRKNEKSEPTE